MSRMVMSLLVIIACCLTFRSISAQEPPPQPQSADQATPDSSAKHSFPGDFPWLEDYGKATDMAERQGKMLLIYFRDSAENPLCKQFESEALADTEVIRHLRACVGVILPVDTKIVSGGEELTLQDHPSFSNMARRPGVAIVDYQHKDTSNFGCVVSQFPFIKGRPYNAQEMQVVLTLPEGTLTQRTLVYAVRVHPESPESTDGPLNLYLATQAQKHSDHQAKIRQQGHHQWPSRFQQINGVLGGGLLATEVCAESWPGEGLVEAAIECVRCWRTSSGHWRSVSGANGAWGYDMKLGSNGIWYATGIFGR